MKYFISGGCKNGKSMLAQKIAQKLSRENGLPLYYVATMIPVDEEDRARIRRHIGEREGWGFTTIEEGRSLDAILDRDDVDPKGVFLVDSLTALLSNDMFPYMEDINMEAAAMLEPQVERFTNTVGGVVFVSDYIYSDPRKFDEYTEAYRKGLALLDRKAASVCGQVVEVTYGMNYYYKGGNALEKEEV